MGFEDLFVHAVIHKRNHIMLQHGMIVDREIGQREFPRLQSVPRMYVKTSIYKKFLMATRGHNKLVRGSEVSEGLVALMWQTETNLFNCSLRFKRKPTLGFFKINIVVSRLHSDIEDLHLNSRESRLSRLLILHSR